jgi:hypothetical protein
MKTKSARRRRQTVLGAACILIGTYACVGTSGDEASRQTSAVKNAGPAALHVNAPWIAPPAPVLTQHNDNARTGAYLAEKRINVGSLRARGMKRKLTLPVVGRILGQPLYVPGLVVAKDNAAHDTVIVTTETNRAYAFDVVTGQQLWVNETHGVDPFPNTVKAGGNSTGVIDLGRGRFYAIFGTQNSYWIDAIDLASGRLAGEMPIDSSITYQVGDSPVVAFDPKLQLQRPALLQTRDGIYVGFGSNNGNEGSTVYHGWILRFDADTLRNTGAFCTTPNVTTIANGAGIWQTGGGLVGDAAGNVYFATGNGDVNPGRHNYGQSLIELPGGGGPLREGHVDTVEDPYENDATQGTLARGDLDFGAGGVVLVDGNTLLSGGKTGVFYLRDRATFAKNQRFQAFFNTYIGGRADIPANWKPGVWREPPYAYDLMASPHLHNTPVYWRGPAADYGIIYGWSEKDYLKAFKYDLATHTIRGTDFNCPTTHDVTCSSFAVPEIYDGSNTSRQFSPYGLAVMPGGLLSLSADGTKHRSGVVWSPLYYSHLAGDAPGVHQNRVGAFDAETLELLWYDAVDAWPKWPTPTVADGRLFATSYRAGAGDQTIESELRIYELPLGAPVARAAFTPGSGAVNVTWVSTDVASESFQVEIDGGATTDLLSSDTTRATVSVAAPAMSRVRVCTRKRDERACSDWVQPADVTTPTWFDITRDELDATTWGFDAVDAVSWAQASRAAYGFCQRIGYTAGQLNGWQSNTTYGAFCYGGGAAFENTTNELPTSGATHWGFTDVNAVGWAQASRAADEICRKDHPGSVGGQLNGNQNGQIVGLACYGPSAQWIDLPKSELRTVGTPIDDQNVVAWAYAARAANEACRRRSLVGGRFNGWQSSTTLGLVCYFNAAEAPPQAPSIRAVATPGGTSITAHWLSNDARPLTFDVEIQNGPASRGLAASARTATLASTDPMHAAVRVCAVHGADRGCSAWATPSDLTAPTWFDITRAELNATGWGFDSVDTVSWAQASRAAYAFCAGLGYTGGQLNGWQSTTTYGAVCYGGGATLQNTTSELPSSGVTHWGFTDVNAVGWAQASRAADEICHASGAMSGQLDGNQSGAVVGLVCYGGTARWFDLPKSELQRAETPMSDANNVAWGYAARVAHEACKRRGFVGGRLNGWQSDTTFGLVCY